MMVQEFTGHRLQVTNLDLMLKTSGQKFEFDFCGDSEVGKRLDMIWILKNTNRLVTNNHD